MSDPLVECIPNFSEGRRLEVIDALCNIAFRVPGILLLDRHTDPDHNRSVITLAGPPDAVETAAFLLIQHASKTINLNDHHGTHPRIGSTDVVPFVPLRNCSLVDCSAIALRLGKRVATDLGIPVYLYESAALRPDRYRLECIRKGGFEQLRGTIASDPARFPDFGPHYLGSAGATAIGARNPLIAFNAYLDSNDIGAAKNIATEIRESGGGFTGVKALGMLVKNSAQVSMNLSDYAKSSLSEVVAMIRKLAGEKGLQIEKSEIVGLIPLQAMIDAASIPLRLESFTSVRILELGLAKAMLDIFRKDDPIRPCTFIDQDYLLAVYQFLLSVSKELLTAEISTSSAERTQIINACESWTTIRNNLSLAMGKYRATISRITDTLLPPSDRKPLIASAAAACLDIIKTNQALIQQLVYFVEHPAAHIHTMYFSISAQSCLLAHLAAIHARDHINDSPEYPEVHSLMEHLSYVEAELPGLLKSTDFIFQKVQDSLEADD